MAVSVQHLNCNVSDSRDLFLGLLTHTADYLQAKACNEATPAERYYLTHPHPGFEDINGHNH